MRTRNSARSMFAAVAALSLVVAACGGDDDDGAEPPAATEAPETETTDAPEPETTDAPEPETTEAPETETTEAPEPETTEAPATTEAPEPPAEPEMSKVGATCAPTFTNLPTLVAQSQGFFADEGIEVECVQIGNGPELAAALIAGDAQFAGNIPFNVIPLVQQGFDLVAMRQSYDAMFFDILVRADYPLPSAGGTWEEVMADLVGSNVGVVARGVSAEDIARALFTGAGLDPDAQTYIATGLGATTLAALEAGEVDMAITFEPALTTGVLDGIAVQPFRIAEGAGPAPVRVPSLHTTASREFYDANPNTVCAYVRGMNTASAWVVDAANRDAVLQIMQDQLGVPTPELAGAIYDNNIQYIDVDGGVDAEAFDLVGEFLLEIGKVESLTTAADVIAQPSC